LTDIHRVPGKGREDVPAKGDRSVGQVAKDFDLTETAVRSWAKQAEIDAGTRTDGPHHRRERRPVQPAQGEPTVA
jgi:transposase-like protein